MTTPLRIIFAGTPEFAAAHLHVLLDSPHQIVACYTQPDRPAGRGKKLKPSPVKQAAEAAGIEVLQPQSLKDADAQAELAALNADLMVVVAYGLLLPKAVLDTPRLGCINVHASLLPRWRGAAPIQRAIEAGDSQSGVTIMQMDVGLDTGDMLVEQRCPITDQDTGGSLHDTLMSLGGPALLSAIEQLADDKAQPQPQDDSEANYAAKITKAEAELNWSADAAELHRKIRAFNPFPVAFTRPAKSPDDRIRIWQARLGPATEGAPGEIVQIGEDQITVACGRGSLCIESLQLPGKRAMAVSDVLRGNAGLFALGERLLEPNT
ncbi:methionyl-tRNA formyltransferase [Gilvimarinus agarilyticus]|uniref:methionyl-tRNA formyltransferase n=1 Tax=unclassified Gilvimarinus TaxID=2642066 RepID=UPI001C083971|nr:MULTISPECIES: methionyl-tRNA formyltransferase [unclassified Gilvimarinus]MBU2884242.1 methionyl-tRNA formyltransferase [Gilvimarinus agarilyticus]MDO6569381.1 methionyl-tRNA formyltransferase [Gilvimarinus sp. 2_MG-2023]MDO6747535.1 methionyl-tRNA formyltransferase [Gilvimarinus sp. 1_MG-2023]